MATYFLRKEDGKGGTIVIPITVELCGRGIVTSPEEKAESEKEGGDGKSL